MIAAITHTDVVCPPHQYAACVCGDILSDHRASDPDVAPTPGDAECAFDLMEAFWAKREGAQFDLAAGEFLDCPEVGTCQICEVRICAEHSDEFVTCADSSSTLHHVDCRDLCDPCARAIAADRAGVR